MVSAMLQLSYRGARRLAVEDVAPPPLRAGEVRVRVHSAGLCKSDVYGYSGVNDRRDKVIGPGDVLVMGHEASGVVEEIGEGTSRSRTHTVQSGTFVRVGDAVAINPIVGCGDCGACAVGDEHLCERRSILGCTPAAPGAFAETVVVPAANLVRLPEGMPLEWGALVEPLAVGAHGVRLADPAPGATALVIGGGPVGIGAALAARRRVGDGVLVLEPLPERRALCERLGISAAPPEIILGGERRFDVAIDCVARPETLEGAIEAVPPQGLVVLVGIWSDYIPLPVSTLVWRETKILGSFGYSRDDFADVARWIASSGVDLSPIIERRVRFDEVIGAFEAYADGSLSAVRTLLQPEAA
jgi:threonine dehydrogenase-like Zn-dependent dehydrogenase